MHRKWKGYFTVEASFILPLVLFLYLMIILSALFLYCRCAISQDNFLLGMRAERFTGAEDENGEVIYGRKAADSWQTAVYVEERMDRKREYYPFFTTVKGGYAENEESIVIWVQQKSPGEEVVKELYKINPVEIIRERRKKEHA